MPSYTSPTTVHANGCGNCPGCGGATCPTDCTGCPGTIAVAWSGTPYDYAGNLFQNSGLCVWDYGALVGGDGFHANLTCSNGYWYLTVDYYADDAVTCTIVWRIAVNGACPPTGTAWTLYANSCGGTPALTI